MLHVLDRQRQLLRRGRRLGPAVVLEHEHDRQPPELREVHRLVEGAGVGRAVAEEGNRDARLAAHLERERGAGHHRQPAAHDRVRAHVPARHVVEVHRAAEPTRAALLLAVHLRHHRVDRACPSRSCARARDASTRSRRPARARRRHRRRPPPGRSRRGGTRAAPRAEAILDLLLEAPDDEHLAQQLAQAGSVRVAAAARGSPSTWVIGRHYADAP